MDCPTKEMVVKAKGILESSTIKYSVFEELKKDNTPFIRKKLEKERDTFIKNFISLNPWFVDILNKDNGI